MSKKSNISAAAAVAKRIRETHPNLTQNQARQIVTKMLEKADQKKG
mgnify:CR=1 FL=1|tara:strand:- start:425 stop:562 length:138 start_codon:yes stop_codon:yes gene_type:complete